MVKAPKINIITLEYFFLRMVNSFFLNLTFTDIVLLSNDRHYKKLQSFMKNPNYSISLIGLLFLLICFSCSKDLPCTIDRYIGTHSMTNDCRSSVQAIITRGPDSNQLIFNDGSKEYLFEITPSNACIAMHQGESLGFGLLPPNGEMKLYNDKIKVSITSYITIIPLKCNYTLELE
jgi:hypothetical protein